MAKTDFKSVDEYIRTFPKNVQATLQTIRRTIQKAVPEAEEFISYQMPAFKFHGRLLYFSAFKNHYSLFGATQSVRRAFKKELSHYEQSKGTLRFPIDEAVPVKLIRDIAMYQAKENLERDTKKVELINPEGTVSGYLAIPEKGTGPGVLVLHAWWGLNDFFRGFCDRLARAGFVAFAPDLYHGATASTIDEAEKLVASTDWFESPAAEGTKPTKKLSRESAREDLSKSVSRLRIHPKVQGKRLGVIGFSLGAFWGLWLAEEDPADVAAVVLFYGTRPGDYTKTQAAFLGHFAEKDDFEPPASVRDLETLLRTNGKDVTFHSYPGTTHWFFEKDRPDAYDDRAAKMAWQRTIRFLRTQLSEQGRSR